MKKSGSADKPSTRDRPDKLLPAILALALGSFAIGITEFTMMGLLPEAVADLEIDVATGGTLISAYALGVVVGAPTLASVLARVNRRTSSIILMTLILIGHLWAIFSPDFTSLVLARFLSGLPHGAYFSIAALAASQLAGPARRGQAVSWVLSGLTVATLVGAPAVTWLGQQTNWRAMFVVVAVFSAATVFLVLTLVPSIPAPESASIKTELAGLVSLDLWKAVIIAVVGFSGVFALYTYIAEITTSVGGMSSSLVPLVMAVYGIGSVMGTFLGGKLADRNPHKTVLMMIALLGASLLMFALTAQFWMLSLPCLLAAGIGASALSPAFQVLLVDSAPKSPQLAGALNHSAFNMANAAGAIIGGAVITAGYGLQAPPMTGAILAAVGLVLAVLILPGKKTKA